ncbi:hypothetical protein SDJN03_22713, partial [Cucurbita argyrosperma subsp. sororia]
MPTTDSNSWFSVADRISTFQKYPQSFKEFRRHWNFGPARPVDAHDSAFSPSMERTHGHHKLGARPHHNQLKSVKSCRSPS